MKRIEDRFQETVQPIINGKEILLLHPAGLRDMARSGTRVSHVGTSSAGDKSARACGGFRRAGKTVQAEFFKRMHNDADGGRSPKVHTLDYRRVQRAAV